jgi:hypothetical protein
MLLGYNYDDSQGNFMYIPYLVAEKPKKGESIPDDIISRALIRKLIRVQRGARHAASSPEERRIRITLESSSNWIYVTCCTTISTSKLCRIRSPADVFARRAECSPLKSSSP